VAQHDDDESDGEGEDSVDKDQELGVSEASRLAGRVHIVLGHGGSGSIQQRGYPSLTEVEGAAERGGRMGGAGKVPSNRVTSSGFLHET